MHTFSLHTHQSGRQKRELIMVLKAVRVLKTMDMDDLRFLNSNTFA